MSEITRGQHPFESDKKKQVNARMKITTRVKASVVREKGRAAYTDILQ